MLGYVTCSPKTPLWRPTKKHYLRSNIMAGPREETKKKVEIAKVKESRWDTWGEKSRK